MTKIDIPRVLTELQRDLKNSKILLNRLAAGEKIIGQKIAERNTLSAYEGIQLYGQLSRELNDLLEHALFMHEALATGRTTVVTKEGRVVNSIDYPVKETIEVDLFTLKSIQAMKEIYGEDLHNFLELVEN